MDSITTRRALAAEGDFVFEVRRAGLRDHVEALWGWDDAAQRADHRRRMAAGQIEIIQRQDHDVGVLKVVRTPEAVELHQIFLAPEWQGQGIGSAMLRHLMAEARERGVPIRLQVLKPNTRAAAFYERLGFTRSREGESHVEMQWTADTR